jgi:amino acid transporter
VQKYLRRTERGLVGWIIAWAVLISCIFIPYSIVSFMAVIYSVFYIGLWAIAYLMKDKEF